METLDINSEIDLIDACDKFDKDLQVDVYLTSSGGDRNFCSRRLKSMARRSTTLGTASTSKKGLRVLFCKIEIHSESGHIFVPPANILKNCQSLNIDGVISFLELYLFEKPEPGYDYSVIF